jgi:alkylation response protein AidB-like acyl-CoA dehydrogenase
MADWCILLARTEGQDRPRHRGLSFFLVDMRTEGIEVRPLKQITGDAEFNEMFFDNVEVSPSVLVGAAAKAGPWQ